MKRTYLPFAVLALAATLGGQAVAADMPNMKGMAMAKPGGAKTGQATGVVTGLDGKAGTVTIKHSAIPAVGWPAMTMTFKATPASLLKGVKSGDKVAFTVKVEGQANEVTALRKQ
jgi:Cu(I)/Ag(I) efflux system periplasmic protein CusF